MTTQTTIINTTGASILSVTTVSGKTLTFYGNTTSPMYSIVEDSVRTLSNEEFVLLKQELSANVSPHVQSFHITSGVTFTVDGWDDVRYNEEIISNNHIGGSSI